MNKEDTPHENLIKAIESLRKEFLQLINETNKTMPVRKNSRNPETKEE